jgi:uncharacterized membrane protein YvbJ
MAQNKCTNCGSFVGEDERYCQSCGENNPKFVEDSQNNQSNTVYSSNNASTSYSNTPSSSGGFGWFILGLFFPLVGFILYFAFKKDNPTASTMSSSGAWVGLIIAIFFASNGYY